MSRTCFCSSSKINMTSIKTNRKSSKTSTIMEKNSTKNFESLNISSNGSQSISTDKKESKKLVCSDSECTETPDLREDSLQCFGCERYVHYARTCLRKWLNILSKRLQENERNGIASKQNEIIEKLRREVTACDNVAKAQQD